MTYRTLLVHVQPGADNEAVLSVAATLAEHFNSKVIGIAACQPVNPMYEEGFAAGDVLTQDRLEIKNELAAAEARFRAVLESKTRSLGWRSTITYGPLEDYIAEQARAADLVIIGKQAGGALFDHTRCVKVGTLAMQAGRPVLLVPKNASTLTLRHVFVGWNDSREARRAVSDALPLLQAAGHATVLEVARAGQGPQALARVHDVACWLERQDVRATPHVQNVKGEEISSLRSELLRRNCDLLVAGAYGHNRLQEWVFGGVTHDLLVDAEFCVLISH
jgi:nucleotide-binding universal stress UspA family protein